MKKTIQFTSTSITANHGIFGNQLCWSRRCECAGNLRAIAGGPVTLAANPTTVRANVDLNQLGVFRLGHLFPQLASLGAEALVVR